jgi:hypothetical protein
VSFHLDGSSAAAHDLLAAPRHRVPGHVGLNVWCHGIHPDSVGGEFAGRRLGEPDDAVLGNNIRERVDDGTAPCLTTGLSLALAPAFGSSWLSASLHRPS